MNESKKSNAKVVGLISAIAILLVAAIVIGTLVIGGNKSSDYYVDLANKYASSYEYDNAVTSYWKAIDIDEKNERAYVGLGNVYELMGDYSNASMVYNLGLTRIGNPRFNQLISSLVGRTSGSNMDIGEKEGVETNVGVVYLNRPFTANLAEFTYGDYIGNFGKPTIDTSDPARYVVRHEKLAASFIYYNTAENPDVIDTVNGIPRADKKPTEINLDNLTAVFTGLNSFNLSADDLSKFGADQIKSLVDSVSHKDVITFTLRGCNYVIEVDSNNKINPLGYNRISPMYYENNAAANKAESCILEGTVINAVDGKPVPFTEITFKGVDEDFEETVTTDSNGCYSLENVPIGYVDVEITCEGYIDESTRIETDGWEDTNTKNFTISPVMAEGEIRIVLTWGETPTDLDSHLDGVSSDGTDVSLSFGDLGHPLTDKSGNVICELDVDDTSSYGPETTTISDINGKYVYWVHDYTRSGTMGAVSGAVVKIYQNNSSPIEVEIPNDIEGNEWQVCSIEKGVVTLL